MFDDDAAQKDLLEFLNNTELEMVALYREFSKPEYYKGAVELVLEAVKTGKRIHVSGIGKPHHIGGYYASLLSSIGYPAYFLDGTEATHGSSGQVLPGDIVICISYYGNVQELIKTIKTVKANGAKIIAVTGRPQSWIAQNADVHLNVLIGSEGDYLGRPPRLSMLAAMLCLQGLSILLQRYNKITPEIYVKWHPDGELGRNI